MSGKRKKKLDSKDPNIEDVIKHSLLTRLPKELIIPLPDANKNGTSITALGSKADQTEVKSKLSQTCKLFDGLFKQERQSIAANKLLRWVLQGPLSAYQNHEAKIIELAINLPHLFFIQSTAQDNAMDLKGNRRTLLNWSPYQAFFGTGNWELLAKVKPHLDAYLKKINNEELAAQQEQEKFPNGFDFPPSPPEFIAALKELKDAINKDEQLKLDWRNPNVKTKAALEQYQKVAISFVVKTGHHHNMNDTINIHEPYSQGWNQLGWNSQQRMFFSVNVIGFDQRLMTEFQLRVLCTGLVNCVEEQKPLNQHFEVMNHTLTPPGMVSVIPLDSGDLTARLGEGFVVDSYYGTYVQGVWRDWYGAFENYVQQHSKTFETYRQAKETVSTNVMRDCLK